MALPASRVSLQQSSSLTCPTFYISISRSYKPTLPGFGISFELPLPETWTGFQTFGALVFSRKPIDRKITSKRGESEEILALLAG